MSEKILMVGGTSGIGEALAEMLQNADKEIIMIARSKEPSKYASEYHSCDVTNPGGNLPDIQGPIQGLVYLPGTINLKPFGQLSLEDFENDWKINFQGAVQVIQHYLPAMDKASVASIVLISTVATTVGMPFHTSVSAAKGALEAFGRSLAAELAPKVRVNIVAPSITKTPLSEQILSSEKRVEAAEKRHPLNRIGEPEDIAEMIHFLLSSRSRWITGQTFNVDGGLKTLRLL